jgi:8-oxo-dGTP diphosphatase
MKTFGSSRVWLGPRPTDEWFGLTERVRVVAAIIQRGNKYLVGRRAPHKSGAGEWEFPGGKPEVGETEPAALEREILEELGVEIRVLRLFDRSVTAVGELEIELACYACELVADAPSASTDHDRLEWVGEGELAALNWAAPDRPALRRLLIPFC